MGLFIVVVSVTAFFGGAYAKKTCGFPFCTGLLTLSWSDFKSSWSDWKDKAPKETMPELSSKIFTNASSATLQWINLPNDDSTKYGGLQYDNKNNAYLYITQNGFLYEVRNSVIKPGNNLNIPNFDFPIKNGSIGDVDYSRLGVRDFVLNLEDNIAIIAVSEVMEAKSCHQVTIYTVDLKVSDNEWTKLYETNCWTVGIADAVGGGLATSGSKVYLTIGTNSRFTGADLFTEPHKIIEQYGLSRVIEIDLHTTISKVYATGFRNAQGITIAPNGNIFSIEHGPQGGDELNLIKFGNDYGFPQLTLGVDYGETNWAFLNTDLGQNKNSVAPIYSFVPSIAPSDIDYNPFYRGILGLTDCELVASTLREESLYFIRLNNNCTDLANIEKLYIGERLRKIALNPKDKTILVTTDGSQKIGLVSFDRYD